VTTARRRSVGNPVACSVCADDWPGSARFCGHCGAALHAGAGPAPSRRAGSGPLAAWLVIAGLALAAIMVAGPGGRLVPASQPSPPGPAASSLDVDVEVPRSRAEAGISGLEAVTGAELRDGAPPLLRCTPGPCVSWRQPGAHLRPERVAVADDLVVTAADTAITGLDARSGHTRWITPVREVFDAVADDDAPATTDASSPAPPAAVNGLRLDATVHVALEVDADAVVVSVPEQVVLLDRDDGSVRWTTPSPGWWVWDLHLLDEVVVLLTRTGRGGSPYPRLAVLDRTTGAPVWDQVVAAVVDLGDEALVTRSSGGTLIAFDPETGHVRWRDPLRTAPPLVTRNSRWLVRHDPGVARLVDPATGVHVTELDGVPAPVSLEVDDLTLLVLVPDPPHRPDPDPEPGLRPEPPRLVALDPDGLPRWQHPTTMDEAGRCCQALLPHAEGVALVGVDGRITVHDLDTGRPLPQTEPAPLPGPVQARSDRVLVTAAAGPGQLPPFGIQTLTPRRQHTRVVSERAVLVSIEPLVVLVDEVLVGIDPWQGRLPPPEARRVRP